MRQIDADKLFESIVFYCNQEIAKYKTMRRALGNVARAALFAVEDAPTLADESVKHGFWMETKNGERICSECKHAPLYDYFGRQHFSPSCWHCGARMDKEENDE